MAAANPRSTGKHRIITHGNEDYKSSQLMHQLGLTERNITFVTPHLEFFPFTDLDEITNNLLFKPNPMLANLIENSEQDVEVSAILVLISQKGIMSQEMSHLITEIPRDPFYDYSEKNETDWWDHVILVFVSEDDEPEDVKPSKEKNRKVTEKVKKKLGVYNCMGNSNSSVEIIKINNLDMKVKDTMKRNEAIKEFVKKSGGRYISILENTSDETNPGEIFIELLRKIEAIEDKIAVGQLPNSKGYRDAVKSFTKAHKKLNHPADQSDRSFIILGDSESGKSDLGNFLLGICHCKPQGAYKIPSGITDFYFPTRIERENEKRGDRNILQIVALPHDLTKHSEIFAKLRTSENVTFLIVLNIFSGCLSQNELIRIKENIQICELLGQNVFENAIIIFTCHGIEPERSSSSISQQKAKEYLEKKLQCIHKHGFIKKMFQLVENQQYAYIDEFYQAYNREKILNLIYSRIEHFDMGLKGTAVQRKTPLFDQITHVNEFERKVSTLKLTDGDKSSIPEEKDIEKEIVSTLRELSIEINTPIIIILIRIRDNFDEEIYTHILRLMKKDSKSLIANKQLSSLQFMGFVFELSFKNRDIFRDIITKNPFLRDLVDKVNHRYVCVIEGMPKNECSRILENLIRTKFQDETTEILVTNDIQKPKQSHCNRITASKQDGILENKFVPELINLTNVAEKNIVSNSADPESMITLHSSKVFANTKSKVPLFSYFTFDKMSSTETDRNDEQNPGPQYNY